MTAVEPAPFDIMTDEWQGDRAPYPQYNGLRVTADEYFELPDDGYWYDVVDGVVVMSPSTTPPHQGVAGEVYTQLSVFCRRERTGKVLYEIDVYLGKGPTGGDLIYRADIVYFVDRERVRKKKRLTGAPDLVVEVISPSSRQFDSVTKRNDYERAAVREYWLFDPYRKTVQILRLTDGRFAEIPATGDHYTTPVIPGFDLNLAEIRNEFES